MIWILIGCNASIDKSVDTPDLKGIPTYYQDVAPILATNCVTCHRADGSGPFILDTYEMAKATATMIEDSVSMRRMPPFHVDNSGECHTFEHSAWLSDEDIQTIAEWVANDTPEGEPTEIDYPSFEENPFHEYPFGNICAHMRRTLRQRQMTIVASSSIHKLPRIVF